MYGHLILAMSCMVVRKIVRKKKKNEKIQNKKEKEKIRDRLMEKKGLEKMKVRFFN